MQIVNPAKIRLRTCSNVAILGPSRTQRALSNGMLRLSIAQSMIFRFSLAPSNSSKMIFWAITNLSIPSDRARWVLLGLRTTTLDQGSKRILARFTICSLRIIKGKNQYFLVFSDMVSGMTRLIIPTDRARRVLLGPRIGTLGQVCRRILAGFAETLR
jgi:hypothetical protein